MSVQVGWLNVYEHAGGREGGMCLWVENIREARYDWLMREVDMRDAKVSGYESHCLKWGVDGFHWAA